MPTDLDALQGTWIITAFELDGRAEPAPPGAKIVVRENRFRTLGMGAPYGGTVELGEVQQRKTVDLVFTAGHAAGVRNVGIYELVGDRWTLCLATRGTTRPMEFATRPGTGLALETLQREGSVSPASKGTAKSRSKGKRAAPAPTLAPGSGPATEIEGEWAMVAAVLDGKPLAADMVAWCKRVTRGDVTTVLAGPQTMLEARFTSDSSRQPAWIDYVNLVGSAKGKAQAGVYELSGDSLQICMARPGDPRPADFGSVPGDGRSLTTWRRAKA